MSKKLEFYKWLVLLSCFLIMGVAFSIVNNITTLFLDPVTKDLGFSLSSFSFIFTIGAITTSLMSPIIGKLLTKLPLKLIMSIGAILTGSGFFCYSLATKIWMFYCIAIIVGIGLTCLTTIPIATTLTHWFKDKKGLVLGISTAGAGTGSFIWMQVVSRLLISKGYTFTYAILGIIIIVVCLPLALFIMRMPPDTTIKAKKKEKFSYKDIQWSPRLILFIVGLFLLGMCISGTKMHIQSYLIYLGHPLLFGGYIFDKVKLTKSIILLVSMALIGYVCLLLGTIPSLLFVFAALFGICLCLPSLVPTYGTSALFGQEHYAMYLGVINMIFTLGGALGPVITGFIVDYFNYSVVWTLYFFITIIYLLLILLALKSKKTSD